MVIGKSGGGAKRVCHPGHSSHKVIGIGHCTAIWVGDLCGSAAHIVFVSGHMAPLVRLCQETSCHGIIGGKAGMAKPVGLAGHPVSTVIGIGSLTALRSGHFLSAVHGVVGVGDHMALRIGLRQPIAVGVIGIAEGISQWICTLQHPVHLVIGKDALLPLPVRDGRHSSRRVKGIGGGVSGCVRLAHAPAFCVVGSGGYCA